MADPFRKVRAGDPLRLPAAAYNAFIDAALDVRHRAQEGPTPRPAAHTGSILVRNDSPAAIDRFGVLGLGAPLVLPSLDAETFGSRVAVAGVTVSAAHAGRFAVLLEPLEPGAVGRAMAHGMCAARVEVDDELHEWAEVIAGVPRLRSVWMGSAQLLWVEPAESRVPAGIAWAIVRLGDRHEPGALFAVRVSRDGGSPGSIAATCSFTYAVARLDGIVLAAGLSPEEARLPNTVYAVTPDNSPGVAYTDAAGELHLWSANEAPDPETC